jgi:hypothetical protein
MSYQKYTNDEIIKLLKITNEKLEDYKKDYHIYENIYDIYIKNQSNNIFKALYIYYISICDKLNNDYEKEICLKTINILKYIMNKIFNSSNGKIQYIIIILNEKINNIIEKIDELILLNNYYCDYKIRFFDYK